jgi:lipoate-protein ligase A
VYFLDLTLPTPPENLALDEALLLAAEADGRAEFLRVWESPQYAVVLGKNCRVGEDVWCDRCRADRIAVLRRSSGGGTVLIGPGCLNYSVVLRYDRSIGLDSVTTSLAYCLEKVQSAIRNIPQADFWRAGCVSPPVSAQNRNVVRVAGSDLIWCDRKFSGSAQRRQRSQFLHHGTILYRFDISMVSRYLKEPRRQPAHRANRRHEAFLTCLPAERDSLSNALRDAWNAAKPLDSPPLTITADLVAGRYSQTEWNLQK